MAKFSLKERIEEIQNLLSDSPDFAVREITTGGISGALLYFEGPTDKMMIINAVLNPLLALKEKAPANFPRHLAKNVIKNIQVSVTQDNNEIIANLLDGLSCLLLDGFPDCLLIKTDSWVHRAPSEPPTSAVINGPREGFVEDMGVNITMLRKRLKTPDLVIKRFLIGKYTNTKVAMCYISSIAESAIVKKLEAKIKKINIDGMPDSFQLQSFLEENTHSMFKQLGNTEKPDIAACKILEGRIAIFVDGSPIALTVPFILFEDFQNSNDYYQKPMRATFLRWLRLCSAVIAILLPGATVAVILYHYKIIPIKLLITILNSTQGIPLSPLLEILFIILLFEILYESSLRMPRYLGLALSVVGALILGDTAVKAGLVSPPSIMVVALTGVMLYTMPDEQPQFSLLRLIFTITGGLLGLFGMVVGTIFLIAYFANLDSYGAPYLGPYAPYIKNDLQDGLNKAPVTEQITRPKAIPNTNSRRLKQ